MPNDFLFLAALLMGFFEQTKCLFHPPPPSFEAPLSAPIGGLHASQERLPVWLARVLLLSMVVVVVVTRVPLVVVTTSEQLPKIVGNLCSFQGCYLVCGWLRMIVSTNSVCVVLEVLFVHCFVSFG
ncbi:hypothetical protein RchiOBHm_Chr1g0365251 [Rosa chinensis]|uniref:Uncharacterized protein n=1 Tax=Rosa chinensis TaxID=74649 RepID=A0A2P6SJY1_ROSCH|nr:hypothetical protein RchiOBHm_Chr1g0365251 [Rosa chinensis]